MCVCLLERLRDRDPPSPGLCSQMTMVARSGPGQRQEPDIHSILISHMSTWGPCTWVLSCALPGTLTSRWIGSRVATSQTGMHNVLCHSYSYWNSMWLWPYIASLYNRSREHCFCHRYFGDWLVDFLPNLMAKSNFLSLTHYWTSS